MNKGIYQHFSIEDRPFLDKGMEWIKKVEDSYAPFLTPFINPHQEKLLKILAKTYGLACSSSGEFVSVSMFEFYYTQIISNQSFQILKYLSRKLCIPINLNI